MLTVHRVHTWPPDIRPRGAHDNMFIPFPRSGKRPCGVGWMPVVFYDDDCVERVPNSIDTVNWWFGDLPSSRSETPGANTHPPSRHSPKDPPQSSKAEPSSRHAGSSLDRPKEQAGQNLLPEEPTRQDHASWKTIGLAFTEQPRLPGYPFSLPEGMKTPSTWSVVSHSSRPAPQSESSGVATPTPVIAPWSQSLERLAPASPRGALSRLLSEYNLHSCCKVIRLSCS